MIRKWMTILLSLLLVAAMPLSALADTQHTLTIVPGDMLASKEALADLLDVLTVRVTEGEKSGAVTVLLNDQEMVTVGLTADSTGLYAASDLLGENVCYTTWDDGFAMLNNLMASFMLRLGAGEEVLQELERSLAQTQKAIVSAIEAGSRSTTQTTSPASLEESVKVVEEMFPDDPGMVEYIKGLYDDMTIEDGSFADENRDTADQKYRMTMDEKDLVALCDTE